MRCKGRYVTMRIVNNPLRGKPFVTHDVYYKTRDGMVLIKEFRKKSMAQAAADRRNARCGLKR